MLKKIFLKLFYFICAPKPDVVAQAKTKFLANMSHEMRTPLNAILGMSEVLAETALDHDQKKYVSSIQTAGDTLLTLINDILDLGKVDSGELKLEQIEFDSEDLIQKCVDITSIRARKKQLNLIFQNRLYMHSKPVGDPTRISQVLVNLVGNAIKFTDVGEILVLLEPDLQKPGNVLFSVKDTGVGIPADKMEVIFRDFAQVDSSTTRRFGGTGLGLSISRKLVELMGGRIWAESEEGRGSKFLFTLPLGIRELTLESIKQARKLNLANINVLVIDDIVTEREVLAEILLAMGATVQTFDCWQSAFKVLTKEDYFQLIFIDCQMPIDGFESFRQIQKKINIMDRTIMMLPPNHRQGDLFLLAEKGLYFYLVKPIVLRSEFEEVVTKVLNRGESYLYKNLPIAKKTVLIVDDDEGQGELIRRDLQELDLNILVAENGLRALDILQKRDVHTVITDVRMPFLPSFQLLRKANSQGYTVPFIFLSADGELIKDTLGFGVIKCLMKPYEKEELLRTVKNAVEFGAYRGVPTKLPQQSLIRPLHILLAEDVKVNQNLISIFLKDLPYELEFAENGEEALVKAKTKKFDLILMDMRMPIMDGYTATKNIRQWEQENRKDKSLVIALTANTMKEEIQQAIEAGCDDYLIKPIRKDLLVERIQNITK